MSREFDDLLIKDANGVTIVDESSHLVQIQANGVDQTADRFIALPPHDGTLATVGGVETLTNKIITDDSNQVRAEWIGATEGIKVAISGTAKAGYTLVALNSSAAQWKYTGFVNESELVTTTNSNEVTAISVPLDDNTSYVFNIRVIASNNAADETAAFGIKACYKRKNGISSRVSTDDLLVFVEDSSLAWEARSELNGNNLTVMVRGEESKSIQWKVYIHSDKLPNSI